MNKISKREKGMLAVLLVLIVGCVYYLFFLTPNLEQQAALKEEITIMDDQVIMAQARVTHLNLMKKEVKAIKEENNNIKEVPAFDNSKKLMNSLNLILSQAVQYTLEFIETEETDGIVRRYVSLEFDCADYEDARAILQDIHDGKYPCVLQDVAIYNEDEIYSVSATLTYFEYVE